VEFCHDIRPFTADEKKRALELLGHDNPPADKDPKITIHPPTN
jgi:hypothetical protein